MFSLDTVIDFPAMDLHHYPLTWASKGLQILCVVFRPPDKQEATRVRLYHNSRCAV